MILPLLGGAKRGHIITDPLLLMTFLGCENEEETKQMFCSEVAHTGKHLLRTQNVSERDQKLFFCVGH